ncbi:MAG: hypothetical protein R3B41_03210 [Candidatus Doudnabacteria bacterium]
MQIKFYNVPEVKKADWTGLSQPTFANYHPDFVAIKKLAQKYQAYPKMIVIGHGGSITTFEGIYYALKQQTQKQVFFLSTIDPDAISVIKDQTSPEDTVVVAISKSGQTVTQLEALAQFLDYSLVIVTGAVGPLADIAHYKKSDVVIHPPIGGRYTGLTEVALLPAEMCGLDSEKIFDGGQELYQQFSQDNLAAQSAGVLYQLEQQGIVDVFLPIYAHKLFLFPNLIVQLCHESFGKNGQGQTYFAHEAPESQHHTTQRFFGGRKNITGWFISEAEFNHDLVTQFEDGIKNIVINEYHLSDLNGINLKQALAYEKTGTLEDAKINGIPVIDLELAKVDELEVGRFIAFWQMFAVYSSALRQVDPFDQPQVENSKKISFAKRIS